MHNRLISLAEVIHRNQLNPISTAITVKSSILFLHFMKINVWKSLNLCLPSISVSRSHLPKRLLEVSLSNRLNSRWALAISVIARRQCFFPERCPDGGLLCRRIYQRGTEARREAQRAESTGKVNYYTSPLHLNVLNAIDWCALTHFKRRPVSTFSLPARSNNVLKFSQMTK